jgi:hypothetical protein
VAHADPPSIDVAPGAEIDAAQLQEALRGRIPTSGPVPHVRIEAIAGGVAISVAGRRREVPLNGATGAEAARLVALAMVDLLDDPAPPEPADQVVAEPSAPVQPVEVGLAGGASEWNGLLATAGVAVTVPAGSHLIGIDAAGGRVVTGALHLDAGLVRLSAIGRMSVFEARGSIVAAPVLVGDGNGDATVLFGFGASVSARVPITGTARFVMTGGADLFANRTEYAVAGMPVAATPWLAPWMTLGFEVAP